MTTVIKDFISRSNIVYITLYYFILLKIGTNNASDNFLLNDKNVIKIIDYWFLGMVK